MKCSDESSSVTSYSIKSRLKRAVGEAKKTHGPESSTPFGRLDLNTVANVEEMHMDAKFVRLQKNVSQAVVRTYEGERRTPPLSYAIFGG